MKCLIVEDDFTARRLMQRYLSLYFECDVAVDGLEAVKVFQQSFEDNDPYDLICFDIMMPNMNGHDALKVVRQIESEHGIDGLDRVKVIMTTALDDSKNVMTAFSEGCEVYLVKPVEREHLYEEVEKLGLPLLVK